MKTIKCRELKSGKEILVDRECILLNQSDICDFEFYITKDEYKGYHIVEKSTGMSFNNKVLNNKKQAILEFKKMIKIYGVQKIKETLLINKL